ncbi:MAG: type I restriction-modification enzyme R subunit C-terminal domain-containing protein [Rivularia sp. (in: cyanobacteria)]
MDDAGHIIEQHEQDLEIEEPEEDEKAGFWGLPEDEDAPPRKFYVDGGTEEIVEEKIYDLDVDNQLRLSQLIERTKQEVRILYRSTLDVQQHWIDPQGRSEITDLLADKGIDFEDLKKLSNQPDADPFDLLCHIAFDATVLTCKQRAERLRSRKPDFFEQYGEDARAILEILLEKYAQKGVEEFEIPTTFKANREFYKYGNIAEIAQRFGGVPELKEAVNQLQNLLYSA